MADRDCKRCKHLIPVETSTNWGSTIAAPAYSCEKWECEFEAVDPDAEEEHEQSVQEGISHDTT